MAERDTSSLGHQRDMRWAVRIVAAVGFALTVVAANWALETWGVVAIGFGLSGPAGVYFAGLAFGLRDALHELAGRAWVLGAIALGAFLSYLVGEGAAIPGGHVSIAVASAGAFVFSELADFAVYGPLRERAWPLAVLASNVVGAVVDSVLFLWLAFGSVDHIAGQVVGKSYMIVVALPIVYGCRRALLRYRVRSAGA